MKQYAKLLEKVIKTVILGVFLMTTGFSMSLVKAEENLDIMEIARKSTYNINEFYRPKCSIIIDAETGKVVWEDQPDMVRKIASMSKLMTIFVALENLTEDELNQEIEVTQKYVDIANNYNLSNNDMKLGARYSVHELLDLIIVPSSNAATMMLADLVSNGDAAEFVKMMNDKAQEIGMNQSKFYNCAGAVNSDFGEYMPKGIDPAGDNDSTPREMATLVYHLIKKYPMILEHTKNTKVTVKAGTPYEETFETYLNSLPGTKYSYEGVDGLKTGSSPSAAFNYAATVKKEDTRFIEIIMGVGDWDHQECETERHPIGNALLDYVYEKYEYKKVLDKGEQVVNDKKINISEDIYDLVEKGTTPEFELTKGKIKLKSNLIAVNSQLETDGVEYTSLEKKEPERQKKRAQKKTVSKTKHSEKMGSAVLLLKVLLGALAIVIVLMVITKKLK